MLENLLETTKAFCTRDFLQRHLGSASEGPAGYIHEFCDDRETLNREESSVKSILNTEEENCKENSHSLWSRDVIY